MGKVLYHATMSLDGFIAGPDDDMSWLHDHVGGPNPIVDEVIADIGALLIGAHTYHGGKSDQGAETPTGKPYGGAWTGPMFVLTHRGDQPAAPGFTFLDSDIPGAVDTAKAAAGEKYVVVFGATTAKRCLEAGLLDEILVHIVPVLLGDGIRLFSQPGGTNIKLERIRLDESPRAVNLWLRVIKP